MDTETNECKLFHLLQSCQIYSVVRFYLFALQQLSMEKMVSLGSALLKETQNDVSEKKL